MTEAPRYAFVTLEPGITEEEVHENLSLYGDVRVMSKISQLSSLLTEMVQNMERSSAKQLYPVSVVPSTLPARVILDVRPPVTPPRRKIARRATRPVSPSSEREKRFRSSFNPNQLRLPTFGSSTLQQLNGRESLSDGVLQGDDDPLSPMQQLQQALHDNEEALKSEIKTEFLGDDEEPLLAGLVKEDSPLLDSSREEEGVERKYAEEEDFEEQPCSSASRNKALAYEVSTEMDKDLQMFMDEEGTVEVPYDPDFSECRPRRAETTLHGTNQARCDVCKRWVRITNTLSRLIAHVFMHAQKQRFVCPVEDCEYSNKTEPITRRHILSAHGSRIDPIDIQNDKKRHSESWKADRGKWAPRCFPDHFETAPGGDIFARVNEQQVLMSNQL